MAFSEDLLAQRNKLQQEILALEGTLGNDRDIADLLSSDSDSNESDDSGHAGEDVAHKDLEAERQQIQREIEALERTLGPDAALVDVLTDTENGSVMNSNGEDSDDDLDLPQDLETCLQMNLVYQEVLKEKLAELERLLNENREQQKELEEQLSGPSYIHPGLPHLRLFLGSFMKPYFKDKLTGLGPPANEETKERFAHGPKPCDEMKIRRWEPWQKILLMNAIVTDTMKRMLQPKLSKMEYLTTKMSKAEEAEKAELQNQITLLEKDITEIRSMKEDQLYGDRHDDHDWDKISNIDFEGLRQPDDLMRFWQNYLHPIINKSTWNKDEIAKLEDVAEQHMCSHWEQIAESLGTNRTAFMCFQTYQRYISKTFRKSEWTKDEDQIYIELVNKMRIGNFIPYMQISYFMEGRDSSQLIYRWTTVLDPSIKKGPWSKQEDQLLLNAVKKYGCKDWWKIKLEVPGRTDNSCRDRYLDCLQANIKRGTWDDDEVELLKKLVAKYGVGKWSKIASEMPNRVDCQCLNKWKWMMYVENKKGIKRVGRTLVKCDPQLKRRRVTRKNISKRKVEETESDTSEDEEEQVPYMDSDGEQAVEHESSDEDCKREYVQPDMKEWIPARRNYLTHSLERLETILVRVPTEAEESSKGSIRNTVLDKMGNAVKTYVGMEPPALQKWNYSNEHAMIMVPECDVKRLLISMRASVMKEKTKTSSSSSTNQNDTRNEEEEDKSEKKSGRKRSCKPVPKATARLSYDLMLAITPWVGNVIMPLSFSERRVCEADIVRKRAADVPLPKSPMFLLFLQALKVDVEGCKKVIEACNDKASLTPGPESRPYSGSCRQVKTVANMLAKRRELKAHSSPLQSSEILGPQLLPQPPKITIPPVPQPQSNTKLVMQSASQSINAAVILPQTFVVTQPNTDSQVGTSHNVVQGMGAQATSKMPQPVLHLAKPVESETLTQPTSCPTTAVSTTEPPTETSEKARAPKRKHKPTMKVQALMDNKRAKLSKKQTAKKQQNSNSPQTVAVLPKTTAWILTPAGLMPVAGIQVQAAGMPNNVQMVFQSPAISTPDLPGNNKISLTAESNLAQNPRPSSDNRVVSSTSSYFASVISASVTNRPRVPQVLLDTKVPTSVTVSAAQVTPSKTACNQNQDVTPMNPTSSLGSVSSSAVRTSQNLTTSCISSATNKVSKVSSVTAITSTPSILSVHPLNISGPGTIPGPQSQRMSHPVSQVVFQQPIIVNQNGTLALINTAGPSLPNAPPAAIAKVTRVSIDSAVPNINKSHPSSVPSACSLIPTFSPSSALNGTSHAIPQSSFVNSPVSLGGLPTDQMCVNSPVSQILPQIVVQQTAPQANKQTVQSTDTTSNPRPNQMTFDPSLIFFEQPDQVKHWMKGDEGITLPGLKEKLPYLPPFVSSINTLTTLLKGRDSLLKSAVQLLPEEHRDNSEEEAKIAAVRKMVSERFKTNQAYLLLKARFLSCFTLPSLLATINPCIESEDALAQEDFKPKQFGDKDELEQLGSLLNMEESELTATQFPGREQRNQTT